MCALMNDTDFEHTTSRETKVGEIMVQCCKDHMIHIFFLCTSLLFTHHILAQATNLRKSVAFGTSPASRRVSVSQA